MKFTNREKQQMLVWFSMNWKISDNTTEWIKLFALIAYPPNAWCISEIERESGLSNDINRKENENDAFMVFDKCFLRVNRAFKFFLLFKVTYTCCQLNIVDCLKFKRNFSFINALGTVQINWVFFSINL